MMAGRLGGWACFVILSALVVSPALAASEPHFQLVIRKQAFEPDTLTIPAGRSVKILVRNEDALPAEFESDDFNRETVIPGESEVPVYVGPLKPGTYKFFNDFHPASTGRLIVK